MKTKLSTMIGASLVVGTSWTQMGCYKDNIEELYPITSCDSTNITWNGQIRSIVTTNCATAGCHNATAAGGYDLSNYAGVKLMVDNNRFLAVIESGSMPKGAPKLDNCTIAKVRNWISNGAIEN